MHGRLISRRIPAIEIRMIEIRIGNLYPLSECYVGGLPRVNADL